MKGIPTGGSISVTLANITVAYCLMKVFELMGGPPDDLVGYKSFVDDVEDVGLARMKIFVCFQKW